MQILDKANLQLEEDKRNIACEKIEWLEYE